MNYEEIALNLINEWELGEYRHHSQKKANLQCRIAEALESVALSRKRETAGSIDQDGPTACSCGSNDVKYDHRDEITVCQSCGTYW